MRRIPRRHRHNRARLLGIVRPSPSAAELFRLALCCKAEVVLVAYPDIRLPTDMRSKLRANSREPSILLIIRLLGGQESVLTAR